MHQKNNLAAQSSSATLHHADDDDDEKDPFADTEEDLDDADDDGARGSWWRGVVRERSKTDGNESDDERDDDDDDDEFGDFAMAEDERAGEDKLVLRPLAVNPAKEGNTRGLSGLWPFGLSKAEKEKEDIRSGSLESGSAGQGDEIGDREEKKAVEVKEAKRRTSIEDPDDDEVVV